MGVGRWALRACPFPASCPTPPPFHPHPPPSLPPNRVRPPGLGTSVPASSLPARNKLKTSGACASLASAAWRQAQSRDLGKRWAACVGRESNPGQLLGRQLCSPLYHQRRTAGTAPTRRRRLTDTGQRPEPSTTTPTAYFPPCARPGAPNPNHTHGSAVPRFPSPSHARFAHSHAHAFPLGALSPLVCLPAATRRADPGRRPRGHHPERPGTPLKPREALAAPRAGTPGAHRGWGWEGRAR